MNRRSGQERISNEQMSSDRLRLHELGQLAISGREQQILSARQARAARNFVERFHFVETFGFDPHFGSADEEQTPDGYGPGNARTTVLRPLLAAV